MGLLLGEIKDGEGSGSRRYRCISAKSFTLDISMNDIADLPEALCQGICHFSRMENALCHATHQKEWGPLLRRNTSQCTSECIQQVV
eukprot:3119647-Pyramimonas_sp.AAC.1